MDIPNSITIARSIDGSTHDDQICHPKNSKESAPFNISDIAVIITDIQPLITIFIFTILPIYIYCLLQKINQNDQVLVHLFMRFYFVSLGTWLFVYSFPSNISCSSVLLFLCRILRIACVLSHARQQVQLLDSLFSSIGLSS